ncbi:hypothetical protein Patl1_33801 [Pistacia atlantica]|uniref:Uncharacterized protein n=1 Tax=Pistacia atlantica TaxID=434234 RepID=A0ACC0ZQ91_9ROSI|nr:hypothetical protein Patl1_33801 [Pistacia atlantica]
MSSPGGILNALATALHGSIRTAPSIHRLRLGLLGCVRTPLSGRERKDFSEQPPTQKSTFPYEHSVHVSVRVRGRVKGSPLLRIPPLILDRSSEGSPRFIAAPEEGSPTNVRCKAPHLIKIILAYSPKKKRADPIEDESEVQQGHFCPPPFSRNRTWTLPLIQLPASKQLAFLYKEWKCG